MLLRLKNVALVLAAVVLTATMTSCAAISTDISELEVPPKLTEEQQAIEDALESAVGSNLTLKYPLKGDYRSAFILRNINKNAASQAVAFYSPAGGTEGPHIAILSKVNNKWKMTTNIDSEGNEIDSIEFGDFNGDGNEEIAVGWRSFNSTDLTLVVYTINGSTYQNVKLGTFTEMETLDMDGDGNQDILLLQLDNDEVKAKARLISYKGGKLTEISSSPLDSTVTSYAGVYVTKIGSKKNGVLIDGYKSESKMITELVYYNNGKLVSPLYDSESHTVNSTMRYVTYNCADINGDGTVEIPMPVELGYVPDEEGTNKNWLVRWSAYDINKGLKPVMSAIMNYTENYYFIYPDKWKTNVTVSKRSDDVWDFCRWDAEKKKYGNTLFTIYVYNVDRWNSIPDKQNYEILLQRNGTVYAVKIPPSARNDPYSLSLQEIKDYFRVMG